MATITPTLKIVSTAVDSGTGFGPSHFAMTVDQSDSLTVVKHRIREFEVDTGANVVLINGSDEASAFAPGVNGCFIYIKNVTASGTEKICVGILHEGEGAPAVDDTGDDLTRSHADSHRTFTLLPGEFAFFPFDYCGDIYAQATANDQYLELIQFDRT
jgi:hypothetical protein